MAKDPARIAAMRREAEAMIRREPRRALGWRRLGEALRAEARYAEAAQALDRALSLDDRNFPLALRLAETLAAAGNPGGARHVLVYAEKLEPDNATLAAAWRAVAEAETRLGHYRAALESFEKAAAEPARAAELVSLARLAMQALDFDRAEMALAKAQAQAPNEPGVLAAMALLLTYQGRVDEAEACCIKCLDVDPSYIDVYPQLSALRKGKLSEKQESLLSDYSRRQDAPLGKRATAAFVLAHSFDARGEVDMAFTEYERANGLAGERAAREGLRFDPDGADAWTAHIIKTFRALPELPDAEGAAPIFIVGLPRSGSTLVESVLNAHSQVAAGGEMPMLPPMFNAWLKARGLDNDGVLTEQERRRFAAAYLAEAPKSARFTDKNLLNIESVGFAAQIFPKAKFIHVRRAPLENGLAIYRQDLLKFWTFATDLEHIGRRYVQAARLAAHWARYCPERFITVQYETFAENFEAQAPKLIGFCDLAWEDACRDFQKAERIAATISAAQVREPVRKRAGRAEAYMKHLAPLRAALEAGGVDIETGAL